MVHFTGPAVALWDSCSFYTSPSLQVCAAHTVCIVDQLQGGAWQIILMEVNWGRNWQMQEGMRTTPPTPPGLIPSARCVWLSVCVCEREREHDMQHEYTHPLFYSSSTRSTSSHAVSPWPPAQLNNWLLFHTHDGTSEKLLHKRVKIN